MIKGVLYGTPFLMGNGRYRIVGAIMTAPTHHQVYVH